MTDYSNPSPQAQHQEEEQTIQLADLWSLIINHKWWYVFSVAVCLFAAAFYLYKTPKVFSRSEKVIVDEDTQMSMMRDLTSISGASRRYTSGTNVDNEMEAFASPEPDALPETQAEEAAPPAFEGKEEEI